jgi:predicted amidohydrolase
MSFCVAVVQFQIVHLQPDLNFARIEDFVRQAADQGAQVVVFPEDCVTGSIFGDLSKLDRDGIARSFFQRLAKTYHVDIVTGSVMEGTAEGNFNTSYYIDASGTVLHRYEKNHLYPSEYRFLQPGTAVSVFDTAFGKAALVICWDLLFPTVFQQLRQQGVQIIYCPSYWYREIAHGVAHRDPLSEERLIDALCLSRAVEVNCAFVYANAAGLQTYADGSRDTLIGHSQIVLPIIGVAQRLEHHDEQMIFQDVDLSVLSDAARVYRDGP